MRTQELPHKKVKLGRGTYYIARYPEGDPHIHEHRPYYQEGYGGSMVKFLLEDGTIDEVKGPFCCDGFFDHGRAAKLAKHLNDPTLLHKATRLTVGKNLWWNKQKRKVFFEESRFIVGDYRERVDPTWSGLELEIGIRGGCSYAKITHDDWRYMWE